MKRFLTTTALAIALGTTAIAESHGVMDWTAEVEKSAGQFYGSDLIGMRIYRAETEYENGGMVEADAEKEWDDIGEVNDLIITQDGNVDAVILGIGGFLGIGERDVAVRMDSIRVLTDKDDADDRFLVVNATRENLEAIPVYERHAAMDGNDVKTDANETAMAPPAMNRPTMERDGYAEVEMTEARSLNTEDLTGARVYGVNDEDLGEISELLVEDGKLTKAIIDVGGFLGMGEKPVAVAFDDLQILQHGDDGSLVIYMDATEESLKAQPEYEG